jgi:hypothetical protein
MRACAWLLAVVAAASAAGAATPSDGLDGSWTGTRNGAAVTWEMRADGRLRIDGRGADYVVRGDSLLVTFDVLDPTTPPETALYRFAPEEGASRLFVYGFDLGRQGPLLYRMRIPELAEDVAPPLPPLPAPEAGATNRPAPVQPGAR